MSFLPIVARELRLACRHPTTYRLLVLARWAKQSLSEKFRPWAANDVSEAQHRAPPLAWQVQPAD
jgi:hypothetical protein